MIHRKLFHISRRPESLGVWSVRLKIAFFVLQDRIMRGEINFYDQICPIFLKNLKKVLGFFKNICIIGKVLWDVAQFG